MPAGEARPVEERVVTRWFVVPRARTRVRGTAHPTHDELHPVGEVVAELERHETAVAVLEHEPWPCAAARAVERVRGRQRQVERGRDRATQ